jgi:hypothetical protein
MRVLHFCLQFRVQVFGESFSISAQLLPRWNDWIFSIFHDLPLGGVEMEKSSTVFPRWIPNWKIIGKRMLVLPAKESCFFVKGQVICEFSAFAFAFQGVVARALP